MAQVVQFRVQPRQRASADRDSRLDACGHLGLGPRRHLPTGSGVARFMGLSPYNRADQELTQQTLRSPLEARRKYGGQPHTVSGRQQQPQADVFSKEHSASANVPNFPATGPVGDHAVVKHPHLSVYSILWARAQSHLARDMLLPSWPFRSGAPPLDSGRRLDGRRALLKAIHAFGVDATYDGRNSIQPLRQNTLCPSATREI